MTTLKAQMASDVSAVFQNTDEFAETWKHWPEGVAANETTVVVNPDFPMGEDGTVQRELTRGDEQVIRFKIWIANSVTVTTKDVWLNEDDTQFQTITVGEVEEGMRPITIQRNDKDHSSRSGAGTLL